MSHNNFLDSDKIITVAEKTKYFSTQHIKTIFKLSDLYQEFTSSPLTTTWKSIYSLHFILACPFQIPFGVKIQSRVFMHENLWQAEKYLIPAKKGTICLCNRIQEQDD